MYRLLEVGEVIENGDEYYGIEDKWLGFPPSCLGMKKVPHDAPIRRLVKPAATAKAPSVPDPGDGYRLIDKAVDKPEKGDEIFILGRWQLRDSEFIGDAYCNMNSTFYRRKLPAQPAVDPGEGWRLLAVGEKIERGDEYWSVFFKQWNESENYRYGSGFVKPANEHVGGYRRRVAQPAPVVSVGDRVKVLSGPWAGCTGVVTGFKVEVNLHGFGRMTARKDSVPVVEMDHVRVGGQRLTVKESKVEPLPPVVPEVLFRDLSHGETVKAGDQFWTFGLGPWVDAGPTEVGDTITTYKARHRRPVRVQSPGWRYLDAGETVQAGDEIQATLSGKWDSVSGSAGTKVGDNHSDGRIYFFRRKLPANQGG